MKVVGLFSALAVLGMLNFAAPAPAFAQSGASAMDPAAMGAAQRMRAYLKGLKSFEVRADATMEESIDNDLKVELTNRVRYEYRAPDRLFAEWQSDRQLRRLYYDGKTLSLVSPLIGYYGATDMTGSVADVLKRASERHGIVFPLPDLFLWAWSDEPAQGVTAAMKLGYARIAGVDTDHYLFRQQDVDWQIWIERGDRPLPRKIVITDRTDPTRPSYSALLQWNPNIQLASERFSFDPPPGAAKIEVARLGSGESR